MFQTANTQYILIRSCSLCESRPLTFSKSCTRPVFKSWSSDSSKLFTIIFDVIEIVRATLRLSFILLWGFGGLLLRTTIVYQRLLNQMGAVCGFLPSLLCLHPVVRFLSFMTATSRLLETVTVQSVHLSTTLESWLPISSGISLIVRF